MATTAVCKGSAQLCKIRIARLDATCAFVEGANQAATTSAIIRINSTPDYAPGDDFEMKNGCGILCVTLKTCDQLKRVNLALELCLRDPAMIELLTGATVYSITDGPDTQIMGYSRRGVGATCPDSISVEIWTKAVTVQNVCVPAVVGSNYLEAQWWRTVYPKATFTLGDVNYANELATLSLAGFGDSNPNFLNGPFNDVPVGITLDPTSPEHSFLDLVGPPAGECGYLTVPVQA